MHHNCFTLCLLTLFVCTGCDSSQNEGKRQTKVKKNIRTEYIYRKNDEKRLSFDYPKAVLQAPYPWEKDVRSGIRRLTKEYFRCKGSNLNPPKILLDGPKELERTYDCGGQEKHSLPLRDEKEFIYPVLLELLNEIQIRTEKQVVITSGHRCPIHNTYLDSSPKYSASKHMIGAEVDFFVQGLEEAPESIVKIIMDIYAQDARYKDLKEFTTFLRYEKESEVSTQPWYNKEIFIKIHRRHEGRNWDNRHPYPYITIQVRFDRDLQQKVNYSPSDAQRYLRY